MNKDAQFLTEAYDRVLEEAKKKKLSKAQKKIAAAAPPPDEITGDDFKALKSKKDKKKLEEAYDNVIEEARALVKKKHYNEYKTLTKWLLDNKDKHGKKDYEKAKTRRDQLVSIFKEEGMEPHEVKDSFAKKPEAEGESKEDVAPDTSATCTQCGDAGHAADNCPENAGTP